MLIFKEMLRLLLGFCVAPLGIRDSQEGKGWPTELQATTPNPILGFSAAAALVWMVAWGGLPMLGLPSLLPVGCCTALGCYVPSTVGLASSTTSWLVLARQLYIGHLKFMQW